MVLLNIVNQFISFFLLFTLYWLDCSYMYRNVYNCFALVVILFDRDIVFLILARLWSAFCMGYIFLHRNSIFGIYNKIMHIYFVLPYYKYVFFLHHLWFEYTYYIQYMLSWLHSNNLYIYKNINICLYVLVYFYSLHESSLYYGQFWNKVDIIRFLTLKLMNCWIF